MAHRHPAMPARGNAPQAMCNAPQAMCNAPQVVDAEGEAVLAVVAPEVPISSFVLIDTPQITRRSRNAVCS